MFVPAAFEVKDDSTQSSSNVDFSFFMTEKANIDLPIGIEPDEPKRRGRPPKKQDGFVPVNNSNNNQAQMPFSNQSYGDSYAETTMMLQGSIGQIDQLSVEIKSDIDAIRASKALKNKYKYITDLTSTSCALINTKVGAIDKINSSITNTHNLDLKRIKEMKIDQNEQTDDRRILDLYNAFISTPVGNGGAPMIAPSIQDMTMISGVPNMIRADMGGTDMGFQNYLNTMTPEQNRMRIEGNPNIETVVVFNQDNGARYFDVIDRTTGQSIPNVTRPDPFVLDDCNINVSTMTAKNNNLNQNYRLVTVGNGRMSEY